MCCFHSRVSGGVFIQGYQVLLLEAGSDGSLLTEIPAAVGATLGSSLDW